jgi:PAS domain S-box-containing protein
MSQAARISVLCVDDEPGMADIIGTYLERADESISATSVTSVSEAIDRFETDDIDCIVSDYDMPEVDGLVFLESVRAEDPDFPFILFTGRGSEEIASEAISAGVTDYMQKESTTDQYQVLARRVRNAVSRYRLSSEVRTAREHAETILQASPNAIVVTVDDECVYANRTAVDLFESTKEELLGRTLGDLPDTEGTLETMPSVRDGDGEFDQRRGYIELGDRSVPIEATARRVQWGEDDATVFILTDISERVEHEREVEYQKSLLDSTFEAIPDGVLVTTDDWEVLTYNDQFDDLWGLSEEILETGDAGLLLDAALDELEDPEAFREAVEYQFEHPKEPRRTEVRLRDGTVLDQCSAPVYLDGDIQGFVWVYRDITDLTELERTQQEAFDRMTDAVFALDDDWTVTFLNQHAETLLQRAADDLLGERIWEAFPEAVDTEFYDQYHAAVEDNEPRSFTAYYGPLETRFEVRAFPSETGLTVYFRDVTEERHTETQLRESVDALHSLYEIASNTDLSFPEKRKQAVELGADYLDVTYGFATEITETEQVIVESTGTHELLQAGESCPLDEAYCRKTVATESGLLAVSSATAEGWAEDPAYERFELGTYIGGRVVVNDDLYGTVCFADSEPRQREFSEMEETFVELLTRWLSYEVEQQEYLRQLEAKNDQLEEFASIVSHDLRNPLSVATGRLELLAEDSNSEHIGHIERAHDRMNRLIDDILTLAREGDVIDELTHVALADTCESCWNNVETREASLDVTAEGTIVADESRLTQLLENLFRNAVEHGGDAVTITVGDRPDGFYVEDDGRGIPEAQRDRLFEAGYSTKDSGTGIGLRIVHQIAAAHGWEVSVDEGAEGGTRFEFIGTERPDS